MLSVLDGLAGAAVGRPEAGNGQAAGAIDPGQRCLSAGEPRNVGPSQPHLETAPTTVDVSSPIGPLQGPETLPGVVSATLLAGVMRTGRRHRRCRTQ
jgi:hypothetical protein